MVGPTDWLVEKRDALDEEAAELEERLQEVRAKREVVSEIIEDWRARTGDASDEASSGTIPSVLDEDMNTREAVTEVLRRAEKPLTTKEIAARAGQMGKQIKVSSVRWDANKGADVGVYVKLPPENGSRAKRYRLAE